VFEGIVELLKPPHHVQFKNVKPEPAQDFFVDYLKVKTST
jgi:hypothetical protein